jgi:hypothetical protein
VAKQTQCRQHFGRWLCGRRYQNELHKSVSKSLLTGSCFSQPVGEAEIADDLL